MSFDRRDTMHSVLQTITRNKLIAVIRGAKSENVIPIAEALLKGGVNIFEVTSDTPNVFPLIEEMTSTFQKEAIVGVGTVLDAETARMAILSGAQFIFSPTLDLETIRMTKRYGVVSIPGAMTPTEILTAYEHGADMIKVFPSHALGPSYIKDVHGPLPHIPLIPTGGINLENIDDYFQNGAVAAGLGGSLVDTKQPIHKENLNKLTKKAKQFRQKIKRG